MNLNNIKGVGTATISKLEQLGIYNIRDLLLYLPSSYIDMNNLYDMRHAISGRYYLFLARVHKISKINKGRKVNRFKATLITNSVKINAIWFNQHYMYNKLNEDIEYRFFGKIIEVDSNLTIYNPIFESACEDSKLSGVLPIYRTKGLIHQGNMRNIISAALDYYSLDSVTNDINIVSSFNDSLRMAHKPLTYEDALVSHRRIAIEEIVNTIIKYKIVKNKDVSNKNRLYNNVDYSSILNNLPYRLTISQIKAINDIINDLKCNKPMNRLLIGDVGSGKTIVALIAAFTCCLNGYQCSILAPTTILAEQHYDNSITLRNLGIKVELLSGDTSNQDKNIILRRLERGDIDVLIGTHSVIGEGVLFKSLGLVITDEQHRFGVNQKSTLEIKGKSPDTLVMSATPIPRALSLTLYQDLKVSYIDRHNVYKIKTSIVPTIKAKEMFEFVLKEINSGRQAYIVCAKVEDIEGIEIASVKSLYDELRKGVFKDVRVGLIHGSLKSNDKNSIMTDFKNGIINVLISTTVIEVGIDVPNANVMVIMNAEYFGLATLHQLRGRIGRGEYQSYCLLHTSNTDNERLNALKNNNNGLEIAEIDYELRGGGDFIGLRQSGRANKSNYLVKIDKDIIMQAKAISDLIQIDNQVEETISNINNDNDDIICKVTMN